MSSEHPRPSASRGPRPDGGPVVTYSERLWPSPGNWLLVPGAGLAGALMVAPYGLRVWGSAAAVTLVLAVAAFVLASPRIEVRDGVLYAGKAHIPVDLLGEVEWMDGEPARQERGPRLDARAFIMLRGWVRPVVKVWLDDPDDPTPYWLLSTREPARLAAALVAART